MKTKVLHIALSVALSTMFAPTVMAQLTPETIPVVPVDTVGKAVERVNQKQSSIADSDRPSNAKVQKKTVKNTTSPFPVSVDKAENTIRVNRSNAIVVQPGLNVTIPIARGQPNRLVTPFKNPQVVSTVLTGGKGTDCGEACIRDSVVYITTDRTYPVTAFITELGREDVAMSITMIPEAIPPREIRLSLPAEIMRQNERFSLDAVTSGHDQEKARAWEEGQPYIEMLKETFRLIALGDVPAGYGLRNVKYGEKTPVCMQNGLKFEFKRGQVLEGAKMNFYVGTIENKTSNPIEFDEQRCGGWRIAAVSAFPLKLLQPGQKTEVYVAVKPQEERDAATVRRPLIQRQLP